MQTFLPDKDFRTSLSMLDNQRLGKQRLEAHQIYTTLTSGTKYKGWINHPATKMWRGAENALAEYYNLCVEEWIKRGFKNTMLPIHLNEQYSDEDPWWLGIKQFHASHRSNLLRKDPEFYGKYGWTEPPDLPYWWPSRERA